VSEGAVVARSACLVFLSALATVTVTVTTAALAPATAMAAPDRREMKAREAFAAGRYQEALDLYVKLYAELLHPNYLRNIGRCYQDLAQPEQAINSFREYLRKAKGLSADERKEIDGYIAEMEELKRRKDAAPATAATPEAKPGAPAPPPLAAAPPPAESPPQLATAAPPSSLSSSGAAPAVVLAAPPPEEPHKGEAAPIYTRWWFWTLIGVALAGGLGGAAAAGVFTSKSDAACSTGRICR